MPFTAIRSTSIFRDAYGRRVAVLKSDYLKVNSPFSSPTPDGTTPATFHDFAEAQATATVRTLIAQAARPAQTELEALRVALDLRYQSLAATLAGAGNVYTAPIHASIHCALPISRC